MYVCVVFLSVWFVRGWKEEGEAASEQRAGRLAINAEARACQKAPPPPSASPPARPPSFCNARPPPFEKTPAHTRARAPEVHKGRRDLPHEEARAEPVHAADVHERAKHGEAENAVREELGAFMLEAQDALERVVQEVAFLY